MDDKALLGNNSVKQQWKRSDSRYAMTQYTCVNTGDEDVFCVVGAVVISRVWSQLQNRVTIEKSASLSECSELVTRLEARKQDSELGLGAHL
jgi:hypothetical protein